VGILPDESPEAPAARPTEWPVAPFLSESPAICVLALSAIADDPRVRRQAEAFHRAGWKVTAVGVAGAKSAPPDWPIVCHDDSVASPARALDLTSRSFGANCPGISARPMSSMRRWLRLHFRRVGKPFFRTELQWQSFEARIKWHVGWALFVVITWPRRIKLLLSKSRSQLPYLRIFAFAYVSNLAWMPHRLRRVAIRVGSRLAEKAYWAWSPNLRNIYKCTQQINADVWLANDWSMLPIAARLVQEKGGVYGYDTHEFAIEEFAEDPKWRLLQLPMVSAVEREFIGDAAVVTAVSSGIAKNLDKLYRLSRPALTIRNTPDFEDVTFRPTRRDQIQVLYHGIIVPNRGIEAAIDSVALWRPEFTLTIRGPENPAFSPMLRERIAALGLGHRIRLAPAVPMTDLVREAASFDIGFFALPGHSRHNEFALPNKFFEYVMAGLALCTTDLPEMARLIRTYDLGVTIPSVEPKAIAAAINALDPGHVDRFKRNAVAAARELCWERESERLVAAYAAAFADSRQQIA
jgi:glycosyltransferase involved in cell wall biosynthesis